MLQRIKVIDSHTGGEPTRIIVSGGPDLGGGTLAEQVAVFRDRFDGIRSAVVNEPRGSDVWVGGLLIESKDPACTTDIIFFNNAGYLGMCGHGTIGLMATLRHLGIVEEGVHRIGTPVGVVTACFTDNRRVAVENVASYRLRSDVTIDVPDYGQVIGDIAWGGNWFFLVKNSQEKLCVSNAGHLTNITQRIMKTLQSEGIGGSDGPIDHVELFTPPLNPDNHSRNFVLCPGGAYDRSPCGTGTSAKLACLAADGVLAPGEVWRQEGILGTVFSGSFRNDEESESIIPTIEGEAYICGEAELILDSEDPFRMGITS